MKIVYLILCHRFPKQVAHLINRLEDEGNYFFVHIDKKSNPISLFFEESICGSLNKNVQDRVVFTSDSVDVRWGGYSFVESIFILLKEGYCSTVDFDYYALLSVQDYPIKSNRYISNYLEKIEGDSLIEHKPYSEILKNPNRLNRYYFYNFYSKDYNGLGVKNYPFRLLTKIMPERNVFFDPYFGRVWWFLYKTTVEYLLYEQKKENRIMNFMKYSLLPEELLFPTILVNSELKDSLVDFRTTYADYSQAHPKILGEDDIKLLLESESFFARKFNFDIELLGKIDEKVVTRQ